MRIFLLGSRLKQRMCNHHGYHSFSGGGVVKIPNPWSQNSLPFTIRQKVNGKILPPSTSSHTSSRPVCPRACFGTAVIVPYPTTHINRERVYACPSSIRKESVGEVFFPSTYFLFSCEGPTAVVGWMEDSIYLSLERKIRSI